MRALLIAAVATFPMAAAAQDRQSFDQLERGKYLTTMGDCVACHSAEGGQPFAGGRTIETPFGNLISPNLTPDVETGIGAWTDDEFVHAMQHGINRAGQHLYPAFPYVYYTHVTRTDILAIRDYLTTLAPVRNKVVANQLPFPMNVRADLTAWDALNFKPGEFTPDSKQSPEWNRGAYIVTGLEHCGLCHTPKNVSGGDETDHFLQGAPLQGWYAPNITGDKRAGIGNWSVDDIVQYLKTGHNQFAAASGPMREEVQESSYALHDDDLRSIATYLKALPGQDDNRAPVAADDPAMKAGEAIYVDQCSACHMQNGKGVPRLFPSLAGAPTVQQSNVSSLERVVIQGAQSAATPGAVTGPAMPSYGWHLSDDEIANVLTYIRNSWGNAAPAVTAASVKDARESLRQRSD